MADVSKLELSEWLDLARAGAPGLQMLFERLKRFGGGRLTREQIQIIVDEVVRSARIDNDYRAKAHDHDLQMKEIERDLARERVDDERAKRESRHVLDQRRRVLNMKDMLNMSGALVGLKALLLAQPHLDPAILQHIQQIEQIIDASPTNAGDALEG